MQRPPEDLVFVVRMWQQGSDADHSPTWRGYVAEVRSGTRFYVTDSRDIADFIAARVAEKREPV